MENCETLPMLGDWRLVIVQGLALLESGKAKDEAQEARRSWITLGVCAEHLPRLRVRSAGQAEKALPDADEAVGGGLL
ncbi:MAG: hypothetical protein ACLUI3_02730 [Christensenellales bacterium]